jgi:hypothetical protein
MITETYAPRFDSPGWLVQAEDTFGVAVCDAGAVLVCQGDGVEEGIQMASWPAAGPVPGPRAGRPAGRAGTAGTLSACAMKKMARSPAQPHPSCTLTQSDHRVNAASTSAWATSREASATVGSWSIQEEMPAPS